MARLSRTNHTRRFQGEVALAAPKGEKTLAGAQQFDVHASQIAQSRSQLLEGAADLSGEARAEALTPAADVKTLHAKNGPMTLDHDCFWRMLSNAGLLSIKR